MSMQGDTGVGQQPPGGASTPQQAPTPPVQQQAQQPPPVSPPVAAPAQPAIPVPIPAPAGRVPTRKLIGDADDIPNDADLIELPPTALKGRLDRYAKKQLRERFGTDNVDQIRADLDELRVMRAEREERRLADLTETQRLTEQLAAAERRAVEAETRAEQVQTERVVAEQDHHVVAIVAQHINPRYMKHELKNLAEYISGLSDAELADPDAVVQAWCQRAVAEDGALAIPSTGGSAIGGAGPVVAPTPAVPIPGQPLTNGANIQRPQNVNPAGIAAPKTFAPGQAGSVNDKEWRDFKRQNGWNF